MKKLIGVLLVGSIALSVVLLGVLFAGYGRAEEVVVSPRTVPTAPQPKPAIDGETWASLRTDDLPAMVQRLRERGVPPEFVRAIITAQVREAYAARMKAVDPDVDRRPFWKSYSTDPKVQLAQLRLHREQQKVVRDLLGDADPQEQLQALYQGLRFETVPPEKVADVQRIVRQFEDARNDIYSSAGGGMIGPEIQKRADALMKDRHAALAQVLTPQELEEWDIRNSDVARNIRSQLAAFNPTEAEFRTIYKMQAEFEERFPRMSMAMSQEDQQRRGEAQMQLNQQIKAALGPVRAPDFDRANDYSYRQTSQLVARLELPAATTEQVYNVQKEIREKLNTLGRSSSTPAEREQLFTNLRAEAETRVTAILGARGFEAYKQYGGEWMQALRPRPANAAARAP